MVRFTLSPPLFFLLALALFGTLLLVPMTTEATVEYGRRDFPNGFIFGSGTSSYQNNHLWICDELIRYSSIATHRPLPHRDPLSIGPSSPAVRPDHRPTA
ncbi:hypothetical protein AKJ16_DCAP22199 [Drosera capensis]